MADIDNIELRSEKVRNIIGVVPPSLVRFGISLIALLFIFLAVAAYCIPYQESIEAQAVVKVSNNRKYASVLIPYRYLNEVSPGMEIQMEFEGYPSNSYGTIQSTISSADKRLITIQQDNYFEVQAVIPNASRYEIVKGMKGTASVLIRNKSIVQYLLK